MTRQTTIQRSTSFADYLFLASRQVVFYTVVSCWRNISFGNLSASIASVFCMHWCWKSSFSKSGVQYTRTHIHSIRFGLVRFAGKLQKKFNQYNVVGSLMMMMKSFRLAWFMFRIFATKFHLSHTYALPPVAHKLFEMSFSGCNKTKITLTTLYSIVS